MDHNFFFFYRTASPFSNWHPSTFELDGHVFNCSEQYMMYGKAILFGDKAMASKILEAETPREQKALGRKVRNFDPAVWNANCKDIVYRACHAKFTQNPGLREALMKTRGKTLVEASPYDTIWGIGLSEKDPRAQKRETWRGTNWLGEVLTQLREDLIAAES